MEAQAKDRALAALIANRIDPMRERISFHDIVPGARTLRRAQLTLHRWAELECNGTIQREGEQGDGKPFRVWTRQDGRIGTSPPIPDREAGAIRRVEQVCKAAGLHYYHQTDPRGCALYVSTEPLNSQNYSSKGVPCL